MTYVLNKNQKQLIAGYQLKEICQFLHILQKGLAQDLGITDTELQNFLTEAGSSSLITNRHFSKTFWQK